MKLQIKRTLQSKLEHVSNLINTMQFNNSNYSNYVSQCIEFDLDSLLDSFQLYNSHDLESLSNLHRDESLANKFLLPYFIITLCTIQHKQYVLECS